MKRLLLLTLASCTTLPTAEVVKEPAVKVVNRASVLAIVAASSCPKAYFKERGHGPKGFFNGMALLYAKHYCTPNETTKHFNGPVVDTVQDILNTYKRTSMRDLFTLSLSAGMFESSGKYTCGRDMSANFSSENSAEAGMFQTSWGASAHDPYMKTLLEAYSDPKDCLLEVFKEGVPTSSTANAKNWGDPATSGYKYQALSKACPAFHVEYSLIAERKHVREFGPARSGKLEYKQECSDMFAEIEKTCDN